MAANQVILVGYLLYLAGSTCMGEQYTWGGVNHGSQRYTGSNMGKPFSTQYSANGQGNPMRYVGYSQGKYFSNGNSPNNMQYMSQMATGSGSGSPQVELFSNGNSQHVMQIPPQSIKGAGPKNNYANGRLFSSGNNHKGIQYLTQPVLGSEPENGVQWSTNNNGVQAVRNVAQRSNLGNIQYVMGGSNSQNGPSVPETRFLDFESSPKSFQQGSGMVNKFFIPNNQQTNGASGVSAESRFLGFDTISNMFPKVDGNKSDISILKYIPGSQILTPIYVQTKNFVSEGLPKIFGITDQIKKSISVPADTPKEKTTEKGTDRMMQFEGFDSAPEPTVMNGMYGNPTNYRTPESVMNSMFGGMHTYPMNNLIQNKYYTPSTYSTNNAQIISNSFPMKTSNVQYQQPSMNNYEMLVNNVPTKMEANNKPIENPGRIFNTKNMRQEPEVVPEFRVNRQDNFVGNSNPYYGMYSKTFAAPGVYSNGYGNVQQIPELNQRAFNTYQTYMGDAYSPQYGGQNVNENYLSPQTWSIMEGNPNMMQSYGGNYYGPAGMGMTRNAFNYESTPISFGVSKDGSTYSITGATGKNFEYRTLMSSLSKNLAQTGNMKDALKTTVSEDKYSGKGATSAESRFLDTPLYGSVKKDLSNNGHKTNNHRNTKVYFVPAKMNSNTQLHLSGGVNKVNAHIEAYDGTSHQAYTVLPHMNMVNRDVDYVAQESAPVPVTMEADKKTSDTNTISPIQQ